MPNYTEWVSQFSSAGCGGIGGGIGGAGRGHPPPPGGRHNINNSYDESDGHTNNEGGLLSLHRSLHGREKSAASASASATPRAVKLAPPPPGPPAPLWRRRKSSASSESESSSSSSSSISSSTTRSTKTSVTTGMMSKSINRPPRRQYLSRHSHRDVGKGSDSDGGGGESSSHSTRLNELIERRRQLVETRRRREQLLVDARRRRQFQEQTKMKQKQQHQHDTYGSIISSSSSQRRHQRQRQQRTRNYIIAHGDGGKRGSSRREAELVDDFHRHDSYRYQHQQYQQRQHHYDRHHYHQNLKTNNSNDDGDDDDDDRKKKMYYSCDNCHQTFENYNEADRHERSCKTTITRRGRATTASQNQKGRAQHDSPTNTIKQRRNYDWKKFNEEDEEETYFEDGYDPSRGRDVMEDDDDDDEGRDDGDSEIDRRLSSQSKKLVASPDYPRTAPASSNGEWAVHHSTGHHGTTKQWICEVCEQARFDDYTMAVKHEIQCRRQLYFTQQQEQKQEMSTLQEYHDESEAEGTNKTWRIDRDGSYSEIDDESSSSPASYHGPDENNDDVNSIVAEGDFDPITDYNQRTDQIRKQLVSTIIEKTRQLHVAETSAATPPEKNLSVSQIIASTIRGTTNTWLCAVCRMRTFDSYQKACEHEKECSVALGKDLQPQELNKNHDLEDVKHNSKSWTEQQNRVFRSFRHQIQF